MKKITLKDIANELGVTVGTVSHVLNGVNDISIEMKNKVLETAEKLGYVSNASAVSLRTGKTNSLAIIIPDVSNPYFAQQIKILENRIRKYNYTLIILNTNEDEKIEFEAIKTAIGKQVDGILFCPCQQSTRNVEFLNSIGIPFVLFGRFFKDLDFDYICTDDVKGGYLAGKYLADRGYKNPIYIGSYRYIETSINRFSGMIKAFSEAGVSLDESRFFEIGPRADFSNEVFDNLMARAGEFDSVVGFSDVISFKIKSHFNGTEKKDIPVVGFDALSNQLFIPLSNVSVGVVGTAFADKMADVILKKMNGSKERFKEIIDVKLYEFDSFI